MRFDDEGLAELFGRFLSAALEAWLQARGGAQQFAAASAIPLRARQRDEVAELRRALDELRGSPSLRPRRRR